MPSYHEFNFSPSGQWAAYAFEHYRLPHPDDASAVLPAPQIAVHAAPGNLQLDAVIRLDGLPGSPPAARLAVALSAVVENSRGVLSYWALRHPADRPDFHHPDSFVLEIDA